MALADKPCAPCKGEAAALSEAERASLLKELRGWSIDQNGHLAKELRFRDFKGPLKLVNEVGALAEEVGHHPNIYFTWGLVRLEIWTHSINGLSSADFVLAAKIDRLQKTD